MGIVYTVNSIRIAGKEAGSSGDDFSIAQEMVMKTPVRKGNYNMEGLH